MIYLATFLQGILTFISPCILPMIPIYIVFLTSSKGTGSTLLNAIGFIFGFTIVFILMGGVFSYLSSFVTSGLINYVSGGIIILFGLNYSGVVKIPSLLHLKKLNFQPKQNNNFFKSLIFGSAFSLGWTPCLTAFLSTAIILSFSEGSMFFGISLLFTYSLGLAIPFLISALLIEELSTVFSFIKKHYEVINKISGMFLVLIGILIIFNFF